VRFLRNIRCFDAFGTFDVSMSWYFGFVLVLYVPMMLYEKADAIVLLWYLRSRVKQKDPVLFASILDRFILPDSSLLRVLVGDLALGGASFPPHLRPACLDICVAFAVGCFLSVLKHALLSKHPIFLNRLWMGRNVGCS
jgi:hypothetical protein